MKIGLLGLLLLLFACIMPVEVFARCSMCGRDSAAVLCSRCARSSNRFSRSLRGSRRGGKFAILFALLLAAFVFAFSDYPIIGIILVLIAVGLLIMKLKGNKKNKPGK